jgi:hypothetical protein
LPRFQVQDVGQEAKYDQAASRDRHERKFTQRLSGIGCEKLPCQRLAIALRLPIVHIFELAPDLSELNGFDPEPLLIFEQHGGARVHHVSPFWADRVKGMNQDTGKALAVWR